MFLDIQLRGESGFDLLARDAGPFHTVFVTAFDAYAVRAFEVHALDYLLKPVDPVRLAYALARARNPAATPAHVRRLRRRTATTISSFTTTRGARASSASATSHSFAPQATTPSCTSPLDRRCSCCALYRRGKRSSPAAPFVRVHRSLLVNLDFVERIERGEGYTYDLFVRGHAEPLADEPAARDRAQR